MHTDQDVLSLLLPAGVSKYFDLIRVDQTPQTLVLHLEERNILPSDYKPEDYETKDFLPPKEVADFPIRGRAVSLMLSMRRWRHKSTGETISSDWKMIMTGGKVTQEFADFLKELD